MPAVILKIVFLKLLCLLITTNLFAQSTEINQKRLSAVVITGGLAYSASMIGLGSIWYQDLDKFHFFNDNDGWGYMDKLGHIATAQHIGRLSAESLKWTGMDNTRAVWYGGMTGLVFLTSVEAFDGFSKDWGFSVGDVVANALGAGLFISQELLWQEQMFIMKWSYSASPYAQYRPELLGSNFSETWLKDYNGQTYWLSANINSVFFRNASFKPKWLNIAVGYGINGYTGANRNPAENQAGQPIPDFQRYSQFYISPDVDLTKIPTRSKPLKVVLHVLNFVKVPLPGLEYNPKDGLQYHWFAF
ncbi:MAG: DUF2279 domain-containing protein [Bacteroidota bacterium]